MTILFVFGSPGVGKSYVGRVLKDEFHFYCYEADEDLTPAMLECIRNERISTEAMRKEYFDIVIKKIMDLRKQHKNLVITQALIKESNRKQILNALPETQFIHVIADEKNINQRLKIRGDWVSIEYANKIRSVFDAPQLLHVEIDNNLDKQHIVKQLKNIL